MRRGLGRAARAPCPWPLRQQEPQQQRRWLHSPLRQCVPGRGWQTVAVDKESKLAAVSPPPALPERAWDYIAVSMLPSGYPASVTPSYPRYVAWTCVGLLSGRIQSVLATQAALFTIGLGAGAIPMAAAVQWILKDGVGHVGAIIYAAGVNTRFDADAKRYRFQSTIALTLADLIAVLMPLVPQHFFVMASLSSATSSIANLAQVSARARVMSSFAKRGNLADCVRAGQTQGKLMSLLGTAAGAAVAWVVGPEPLHVIGVMLPLSVISCCSMHASTQLVVLSTLNVQRCERVYAALLSQLDASHSEPAPPPAAMAAAAASGPTTRPLPVLDLVAPSPEAVGAEESFTLPYRSILPGTLLLQPLFTGSVVKTDISSHLHAAWPLVQAARVAAAGSDAADAAAAALPAGNAARMAREPLEPSRTLWHASWYRGYALATLARGGDPGKGGFIVALWYTRDAPIADHPRAYWHASLVRRRLAMAPNAFPLVVEAGGQGASLHQRILYECALEAQRTWPSVEAALGGAGWDMCTTFLEGDGGALDWHAEEWQPQR